jgi:hypothetical protein
MFLESPAAGKTFLPGANPVGIPKPKPNDQTKNQHQA